MSATPDSDAPASAVKIRVVVTDMDGTVYDSAEISVEDFLDERRVAPHGLLAQMTLGAALEQAAR